MVDYTVSRSTRLSRYAGAVSLVVIIGLIAMPWWASRSQIGVSTYFLGIVALPQMWNLLAGFGGLLSIGQQAFVGLGGYVVAILALRAGFNLETAVETFRKRVDGAFSGA